MRLNNNKVYVLIALILVFVVGVLYSSFTDNAFNKMQELNYYNLDDKKIGAQYYPGTIDKGVIIVNDLSYNIKNSDLLINELAKEGYHIFVFDVPSQGKTTGYIPYRYKTNTYLAEQYYTGVVAFSEIAKLSADKIHVIASGVGARVALQTSSLGFFSPRDLTLVGINTNLSENLNFDVINFNKESKTSFIKNLNKNNPGTNIHLITTSLNDVSTKAENEELLKLLNSSPKENSIVYKDKENDVTLTVIPSIANPTSFLNYQIINKSIEYITDQDNISYQTSKTTLIKLILTPALLIVAIAILFLLASILRETQKSIPVPSYKLSKEFIMNKMLAWILAVVLVILIPLGLYFFINKFIPSPYFDFMKISVVASYGIVLYILYYKTTFNNDIGAEIFKKDESDNYLGGILVFIGAILSLFAFRNLGISFPLISYKIIWVVIIAIITYFTFYIDERERVIVDLSLKERIFLAFINFFGIFAAALFMFIILKFSLAASLLYLYIIIIFTLAIGQILHAISSPAKLNALIKAVLFAILILYNTVLFF